MKVELWCERFAEYLRLLNRSQATVYGYTLETRLFLRLLAEQGLKDVSEISREQIHAYRLHLHNQRKPNGEPLAVSSQSCKLGAVLCFVRYLYTEQFILSNPARDVKLPKAPDTLPPELPTEEQVEQLIETPDVETPLGLRDRAILEVLYSSAIRNAELRALTIEDVDLHRLELRVRCGKGSKGRVLPLGEPAALWVEAYLVKSRPWLVRDAENEVLFLNSLGRPLRGESLTDLVRVIGEQAKLSMKVTPHILRHCTATHMLARKAGLRQLQKLLGQCQQHRALHQSGNHRLTTGVLEMSSPRELLEPFLASRALYVAEVTVNGDRRYLESFFTFLESVGADHIGIVDFECFTSYREHLEKQPGRWGRGFGAAFIHKSMQVPRLFLNWAFDNGHTLVDFTLYPMPHRVFAVAEIEVPTVDQVKQLLAAPDLSTSSGFRDFLIMEFYYTLAMRRRESHRLDLSDLSLSRKTVRVVGKKSRERLLPLSDRLCALIDRYLRESRPQLRPYPDEQAFWISPQNGGRLGYTYLREIVHRYSQRLGLKIYPHLLRHASATHLLEGGAELAHIQAFLGHSDPNSTERYAKVQPLELKAEFERCHPRSRA